ncbi:MDR/zinc-dependent alcohol dehydrogenase-like family protein [Planctomicrobium sp. SH668]|uniref:MDR/zinc-dependent alcohol dehydrogenase-like family protein n=1 Tax=Planctomicrobium sp. SH668 TaxID=3448126 RepID=UPI003F5BEF5C
MQALVLTESQLSWCDNYTPQPAAGQISIRVLQAGICETDLQLVKGYMGFRGVLGHEFVGVAEGGKFAGKRVVGEINCACGRCDGCQSGLATHCPHRTVLGILKHDGAFADRVWLPEENLHLVPDSVTDDAAVFTEPLAAAFQIPAQLDLSQFPKTAILGDGRLGNLCAQVLQQAGCDPLVIGKHQSKLARLSRLGIRTALLNEIEESRFSDLVVDCTGRSSGFQHACRIVRPRGTVVLKTTVAGDNGPNLAPVVIDEITVTGSRCGPFLPALKALAAGEIEVESLITSRYSLRDGVEAFSKATQSDQMKVLLKICG